MAKKLSLKTRTNAETAKFLLGSCMGEGTNTATEL